ncbi:hypothetical protein [Microbacterium sp. ZW T5_56]|uniref:hypothetical protein n=1 Tax=Microbacterium sp. ZW T5_56 TaxID=3378081 RepID=UPI003852B0DF
MKVEFVFGTIIMLVFFHVAPIALLTPLKLQRFFSSMNSAIYGPPPQPAQDDLDEDGQPLTPEERERRALKPGQAQFWGASALLIVIISFPQVTTHTGFAPNSTVNPFLATALALIAGMSVAAIGLLWAPTPAVRRRVPFLAAHPGVTTSALLFIWAAAISALVAHLFGLF